MVELHVLCDVRPGADQRPEQPVEVAAVLEAAELQPLVLGLEPDHVGHDEAAAGVARDLVGGGGHLSPLDQSGSLTRCGCARCHSSISTATAIAPRHFASGAPSFRARSAQSRTAPG